MTFTDRLGDYMCVEAIDKMAVNGAEYRAAKVEQPGKDMYTFTLAGKRGGGESKVVVTVERGKTMRKGDTVTVKIPASAIPLRHYDVKTSKKGSTVNVTEASPLHLYYHVGAKPQLSDMLRDGLNEADPAERELKEYIEANRTDNTGKLPLYSNAYSGASTRLGDTKAVFTPAAGNAFYLFTENTPVYIDRECRNPLKGEPSRDQDYYYQKTYLEKQNDGTYQQREESVRFAGSNFDQIIKGTNWVHNDLDQVVIKPGTHRLTFVEDVVVKKKENTTGTATDAANPRWEGVQAASVASHLGNNGRVSLPLPGALAITKHVEGVDAGSAAGKAEFTFNVSVPSMGEQTLYAEVLNEDGSDAGSGVFEFKLDKTGARKQTIKAGQTLVLHNLFNGAEYKVSEVDLPGGFTLTSIEQRGAQVNGQTAKGTIEGYTRDACTFTNTYAMKPVVVQADDFVQWSKVYKPWDSVTGAKASFEITLTGVDGAPMPQAAGGKQSMTVEATKDARRGSFGDIEYTKPGVYSYTVTEDWNPSRPVPGVTYSHAKYIVEVMVNDAGNGTLAKPTMTVKQIADDAGQPVADKNVSNGKPVTFNNEFSVSKTQAAAKAKKVLKVDGGNMELKRDQFTFSIKPVGLLADSAPFVTEGLEKDGSLLVKNAEDGGVAFPTFTFTQSQLNNTYDYELREVIPAEAAQHGNALNGVTYDTAVYTAHMKATLENDSSNGAAIKVVVTYTKDGKPVDAKDVVFTNTYKAAPAELPGEGSKAVTVRKTLIGRNADEGEFKFVMTAKDEATKQALTNDEIVLGGDVAADGLVASMGALSDGKSAEAPMGGMKFNKKGAYRFTIVEQHPSEAKKDLAGNWVYQGTTYDGHAATVTVNVEDDGKGRLTAQVTYSADGKATAAEFKNAYAASSTLGVCGPDITVTKSLTGRPMNGGEFSFAITGVDHAGSVSKEAADGKIAGDEFAADRVFVNSVPNPTGIASMPHKLSGVRFTQADANKTFSYRVTERPFGGGESHKGVTRDSSIYRLDIHVTDDGKGKLSADASLYKEAAGGAGDKLVGTADKGRSLTISFENTYAAEVIDPEGAAAATNAAFTKVLSGRAWTDSDEFVFTMKPALETPDAPMPKGAVDGVKTVAVNSGDVAASGKDAGKAKFSFGSIAFTKDNLGVEQSKEFVYDITEAPGTSSNMTYDGHVAHLRITVTDTREGALTVRSTVDAGVFRNTFYDAGEAKSVLDGNGNPITGAVKIGDELLYKIAWANSATNDAGKPVAAKVTVRDTIPEGTALVEGSLSEGGVVDGSTVVWVMDNVAPGAVGEVSFKVKVTEAGAQNGLVKNTATVTVGKRAPETTNQTETEISAGDVAVSKIVKVKEGQGLEIDGDKAFTFEVKLLGPNGKDPLGGSYSLAVFDGDGKETSSGVIQHMGAFELKHGQKAAISGVPEGAHVTVTEIMPDKPDGYTAQKGEQSLEVSSDSDANKLEFVNTYAVDTDGGESGSGSGVLAAHAIRVQKQLDGRDWRKGDSFAVRLEALGGTIAGQELDAADVPMPRDPEIRLTNGDVTGFGDIQFKAAGTYTYKVTEVEPAAADKMQGVAYDKAEYVVKVKVTDQHDGTLKAEPVSMTAAGDEVGIAKFRNIYKAEGNAQNGSGSIALTATKKLSGRPLQADEFSFRCDLVNANAKTGQVEDVFAREATNDAFGTIDFGTITFNSDELNKLASDGKIGRIVDADGNAVWTMKMRAWELTDSLPVGVSAVDDHVDFTITVKDNGDGTLSKPQIGPEGVKLELTNNYTAGGVDPDGNPANGKTSLVLKGSKTLSTVDGGLQLPDIAGKFSFTLAALTDNAPMPAKASATNDAAGNVDFGAIEFTLDSLNEQLGEPAARSGEPRSVDYVYSVTESGSLPGVTNDAAATKQVTITVTDDGEGRLTAAVKDAAAGQPAFAFVNTYAIGEDGRPSVSPTDNGEGRFNVTKRLEGRELQAGEFNFELVDDATGKVAAGGVNDAAGNVELGTIKFTEPGVRTFTLRERKGDKGGVTYSAVEYAVTARAVDNHEGALEVTFVARDADGNVAKDLVFTNTYAAEPTSLQINAVKVLAGEGAKLESGQFEFTIESADDATALNAKACNGDAVNNAAPIEFRPISLDRAGDYHLIMREIKGDDARVTYDDSVVDITFTVVDDQNGKLVVKDNAVKYAVNGQPVDQPVFRNEFHAVIDGLPLGPGHIDAMDLKPAQKHEPAKKPADKNKLVQTGDNAGIGIALVAAAGVAVLGGGLLIKRRSNR